MVSGEGWKRRREEPNLGLVTMKAEEEGRQTVRDERDKRAYTALNEARLIFEDMEGRGDLAMMGWENETPDRPTMTILTYVFSTSKKVDRPFPAMSNESLLRVTKAIYDYFASVGVNTTFCIKCGSRMNFETALQSAEGLGKPSFSKVVQKSGFGRRG